MKLVLALLLALCAMANADTSGRFFEDCLSTSMRLVNRKRFVGGDVFRSVKLTAGQGTLFCMSLCRADENCWSFNINKNRKICFLQTNSNDVPSQRASTWASGYRECVPTEGNWENANTAAADDVVSTFVATGAAGSADFAWTDAVNDAYYTATYTAVLVANGGTCEDTPTASTSVAEGVQTATVTTAITGTYNAYVQTLVDGTVRGCTAADPTTVT